jgi:hypothetical protein
MTLSINDTHHNNALHNAECHYAEYQALVLDLTDKYQTRLLDKHSSLFCHTVKDAKKVFEHI